MFINEILFPFAFKDNCIAIKSLYKPLELKSVREVDSNGSFILSCLIKKNILQNYSFILFTFPFPLSEYDMEKTISIYYNIFKSIWLYIFCNYL